MSPDIVGLLAFTQAVLGVVSCAASVSFVNDVLGWKGEEYENAKVVVGVFGFALAFIIVPLVAAALVLGGVYFGSAAFFAGVRDIYHMVRPKKVNLPEARVHVK